MVAMFSLSLAGFALLGWLSGQSWFYTALGVQPSMTAANDALALLWRVDLTRRVAKRDKRPLHTIHLPGKSNWATSSARVLLFAIGPDVVGYATPTT